MIRSMAAHARHRSGKHMSMDAIRLLHGNAKTEWQYSRRNEIRESLRARRYPISRWYLRPVADRLAMLLAPTQVRPVHLTFCGFLSAAAAAGILLCRPQWMPVAAALVLLCWFFDRCDGLLARRQNTVSAFGAWLDANVDELVDVGLHVAVAAVAAEQVGASWPWFLLVGFLTGKYLFMHGLSSEESAKETSRRLSQCSRMKNGTIPFPNPSPLPTAPFSILRQAYHLPANADVRVHLLVLALASGYLAAELALVAIYYNLRWIARYVLVARRLGGVQ